MRHYFIFLFVLFSGITAKTQDTTFWEHTWDYETGQKEIIERDWGREVVTYLGEMTWKSPGGKELKIRIVTSYQQITKANGFNDRSLLALIKTNHDLIKTYDFVKKQNLPLRIENNELIYEKSGEEISSALPPKFSARFCVSGLSCFNEFIP